MKKTFKVVMLPTEKASPLILERTRTNPRLIFNYNDTQSLREHYQFQELYIISDEEIKEGDCVKHSNNDIGQVIRIYDGQYDMILSNKEISPLLTLVNSKKIVATTDKSLEISTTGYTEDRQRTFYSKLPQLPESFIQAYIKAYNEGNPITEVDLETVSEISNVRLSQLTDGIKRTQKELFDMGVKPTLGDVKISLKTRPDNTVIVHQSKMYSKDEVIKLLEAACIETYRDSLFEVTDKWIQDNL